MEPKEETPEEENNNESKKLMRVRMIVIEPCETFVMATSTEDALRQVHEAPNWSEGIGMYERNLRSWMDTIPVTVDEMKVFNAGTYGETWKVESTEWVAEKMTLPVVKKDGTIAAWTIDAILLEENDNI